MAEPALLHAAAIQQAEDHASDSHAHDLSNGTFLYSSSSGRHPSHL
jgi:hypothetical protein